MPEGHSIHRLARAFTELFAGEPVRVSSPQGRFADGAARLDGRVLERAEAWGKQLFVTFVRPLAAGRPAGAAPSAVADALVLRVHLGLYGSWTFAGDGSAVVEHAIGAPRKRIGEFETVPDDAPAAARPGPDDAAPWSPPAPRGAVRARIVGEHAVADLTGPTACEVLTGPEADAVIARLGADPIRSGTGPHDDPDRFVTALRRSRTAVGQLLMDQAVAAGVGNIFRAESLFRARLSPFRPGTAVTPEEARELWDDLVVIMRDAVATGQIATTLPEHRYPGGTNGAHRPRQNTDGTPGAVPSDEAFYVYHREGLPCRVSGGPVQRREMAGRSLYWCPECQP